MSHDEIMLSNDELDPLAYPEIPQGASETALSISGASPVLAVVPARAQKMLAQMFADPYLLEKPERGVLVAQLRECVAAHPHVSELRVLLGMALCVNFEVPDAIEELCESVRLAPDSYIANLKMGELWMRLRVMNKAEEHTLRARKLAASPAQAEMARRQAASIRGMKQAGIERGGYKSPWLVLSRIARRVWKRDERRSGVPVALDAGS